ncbi:MAG: CtsR family transcriptional regulator, partial [Clostridia bacterium]|nr:CtsR family transcriptional regulator [Clostridia bacterium]
MANISDIIEQFILKTLGEDQSVDISRNELANFFSCAPSQINYVLETRFTLDRGFVKESRRGGGGYIKISKINVEDDNYMNNLILESVGDELSYKRLYQILEKLTYEKIITKREA